MKTTTDENKFKTTKIAFLVVLTFHQSSAFVQFRFHAFDDKNSNGLWQFVSFTIDWSSRTQKITVFDQLLVIRTFHSRKLLNGYLAKRKLKGLWNKTLVVFFLQVLFCLATKHLHGKTTDSRYRDKNNRGWYDALID